MQDTRKKLSEAMSIKGLGMQIQCQNIKCEGCVKKIKDAFDHKYAIKVDLTTQLVNIEATKDQAINEEEIKKILRDLGFLPSHFSQKIKNFFTK